MHAYKKSSRKRSEKPEEVVIPEVSHTMLTKSNTLWGSNWTKEMGVVLVEAVSWEREICGRN